MASPSIAPLLLEDAKSLFVLLENGDNEAARTLLGANSAKDTAQLFAEFGKLTRQLHNSLNNFKINDRLVCMTSVDMPDAQALIKYVIEATEKAANITIDLADSSLPI